MTTIDTILKPFKFVENELLSAVTKVYEVYHKKTGGDQYALANLYITAALISAVSQEIIAGDNPISSTTIIFSAASYNVHQTNKRMRMLDQLVSESNESKKNYERESFRHIDKNVARFTMLLTAGVYGIIATHPFTYPDEILKIYSHFMGALTLGFASLSEYTASIDTNNLSKSKLASKVKQMKYSSESTTVGVEN